MKAILRPLYFKSGMDDEFNSHLDLMGELLKDEADMESLQDMFNIPGQIAEMGESLRLKMVTG